MKSQTIERREKIEELLENEPVIENGYEIPENPARYLILEFSRDEVVWAIEADCLEDAAGSIELSDTDADAHKMIDLDTGLQYTPRMRVTGWYERTAKDAEASEHKYSLLDRCGNPDED